jgi:hypothetical protein
MLTSTLNGTKTVGYVPLRSTIIANNFCPIKWALGMHDMEIFEKLRGKWISEDIALYPPETRSATIECFRKLGIEASEELISLYGIVGGMEDMDDEQFRLWSLNEILEENTTPEETQRCKIDGVLFADYLINSWCYRIKNEVFIDHFENSRNPEVRAKSLTSFFEVMLNEPDNVLL